VAPWTRIRPLTLAVLCLLAYGAHAVLSPCDFVPTQSELTSFSIQGSLQAYDDPYEDDRENIVHSSVAADFARFFQSESFGYETNVTGSFDWNPTQVDLAVSASGDAKWYVDPLVFGIGAVEVSAGEEEGPMLDVTAGVGVGRFRDVTPLAQAIRVQNALLDEGMLLAPLEDQVLHEVAQTLGEPSLSPAERLVAAEELLLATGLLREGALGAQGLLEIERVVDDPGEGRLCGWDAQGRIGVALRPDAPPSEALVLSGNFAFVPDPISQWRGSARWISRVKMPSEHAINLSLSYLRRMGEQWKVRVGYAYSQDQGWSSLDAAVNQHRAWATIGVQLSSRLSLRVDGELHHETGDEELTKTLFVHLDYDVL
jgi:hypothetical protein